MNLVAKNHPVPFPLFGPVLSTWHFYRPVAHIKPLVYKGFDVTIVVSISPNGTVDVIVNLLVHVFRHSVLCCVTGRAVWSDAGARDSGEGDCRATVMGTVVFGNVRISGVGRLI